ncbi:ATP-binding protein [Thalassotalea mangrovi]|uniref:histidine kinase n=1 Tax=Thalassotalea mangrovi TaxID=2572245 RepID=A0A4V5NWR8_9GAMM|nr:ATP-binding protein [Thalassotalea mangrovi]TKB45445.1 GHKL domain-containing protein [Thalassotalea mangrovi]
MSIQRYLLIVIISIVTLASFSAAIKGYKASVNEITFVFDDEMKAFAYALLQGNFNTSTAQQDRHSIFAYQLWQQQNLILRSNNAPADLMSKAKDGFSESTFLSNRWRVFTLTENQRTAMVAQPLKQRVESAEQVLLEAIIPIVYSIPLIGVLVYLAIRKSLRPLVSLSEQLQQKSASDFTPVNVTEDVSELKPVEQTLNHLFARLAKSFEREQRLASDAAHELRTPISVLKISGHNLKKAIQKKQVSEQQIDELNQNIDRMAHVIEQIIALHRTSEEKFETQKKTVDLEQTLQSVIAENYANIDQLKQTIELRAYPVELIGDAFSLTVLFDNLLKNANKYSGANSHILVTLERENNNALVTIEDSGPGIKEELLDKVFERFYRTRHHDQQGSGLGLSIVRHIVDLHHGQIQLEQSELGGLQVKVTMPLALEA